MVINLLKFAIRNFRKNKLNSIINIVGLSLGITATLLIFTYVVNEYSYENYQENLDDVYRLSVIWGNDETASLMTGVQNPLGPALKDNVPGVKAFTRIRESHSDKIKIDDNIFQPEKVFYIDSDFNKIFTFSLTNNLQSAGFDEPYKALISKSFSNKYLNNKSSFTYGEKEYKIVGVFDDVPKNSHFRPNVLLSYKTVETIVDKKTLSWNNWGEDFTYVLGDKTLDPSTLKIKADKLLKENAQEFIANMMSYNVHSLSDIHWMNELKYDYGSKGNLSYIMIFSASAFIILLLACFNYVNLSTASALERMKEVGVRKVIGAKRIQLVVQFLFESLTTAIISSIIGVVLFEVCYSILYDYIGIKLVLESNLSNVIVFSVIGLIFISGLIAGLFPALYLSRYKPIDTIRNTRGTGVSKQYLRRVIVTTQFAISIFLLFGTIVIFQQIDFLKNADIGISKENVAVISLWNENENFTGKFELFKSELLKHNEINSVTAAYTLPGVNSRMMINVFPVEQPELKKNVRGMPVDYSFISSLGLKLVQGRDFNKKISDDFGRNNVIVNESFVEAFGLEKTIGTRLSGGSTIIGVVKNINVQSLHHKAESMIFYIEPKMFKVATIKIENTQMQAGIKTIEKVWKEIFPGADFSYSFLDKMYEKLYEDETKTAGLLTVFSGIAIFISCIGLFGLVAFVSNKKSKEIGVRKVLGASSSLITFMLTKEFVYWVFFSAIIAFPLCWYALDGWLQNFAYRVEIGIIPFAFSLGVSLLLAISTISIKAIKAALANPVNSLRDE